MEHADSHSALQHGRKCMVRSRSGPARMRWLWCVLVCVSLSACSAAYHFRYQYTPIATEGSSADIDNERLRVRVIPTDEVGVLQLTVMNKSAQPLTIVWTRTQYIDPLGHVRPAIDAGPSGLFGPPAWPAGGTRVVSGRSEERRVGKECRSRWSP